MKYFFFLSLLIACLFVSGCAIGPLVGHEPARTVGKSNNEFVGGIGNAGYIFKWNYGLSEDLDIGLQAESYSVGVRGKYAFINNATGGLSLAAALGRGVSIGGNHSYVDFIGSYLVNQWEPFVTTRLVHVKSDPTRFKSKGLKIDFTIDKNEYDYGQFILGTRYWLNTHWTLSFEVSSLFKASSGVTIGDKTLAGATFGYRF